MHGVARGVREGREGGERGERGERGKESGFQYDARSGAGVPLCKELLRLTERQTLTKFDLQLFQVDLSFTLSTFQVLQLPSRKFGTLALSCDWLKACAEL